jgi:hypothetical protein
VSPLTGGTPGTDLRRAVQKCLVETPTAVIVDVTGMRLVDRVAAAAFVALRYDAADSGPGVRLLICVKAAPR